MAICTLRYWMTVRRHGRADGPVHEHLVGQVFGDPERPDGTLITTSRIVQRNGRTAVTASGTRYELEGDPFQVDHSGTVP
jgi:hypothetical protein